MTQIEMTDHAAPARARPYTRVRVITVYTPAQLRARVLTMQESREACT